MCVWLRKSQESFRNQSSNREVSIYAHKLLTMLKNLEWSIWWLEKRSQIYKSRSLLDLVYIIFGFLTAENTQGDFLKSPVDIYPLSLSLHMLSLFIFIFGKETEKSEDLLSIIETEISPDMARAICSESKCIWAMSRFSSGDEYEGKDGQTSNNAILLLFSWKFSTQKWRIWYEKCVQKYSIQSSLIYCRT